MKTVNSPRVMCVRAKLMNIAAKIDDSVCTIINFLLASVFTTFMLQHFYKLYDNNIKLLLRKHLKFPLAFASSQPSGGTP